MAKQTKTKKIAELIEVKVIPERFMIGLKDKKLFHLRSVINETQPRQIEGYIFCGLGDHGFYYTKEN